MIGTVLQDKYKVERKIGEGGFAAVYRGMHLQLKRPVAIKVLVDGGEDARVKTRFLREAESMAKLSHPNIVTVYDFAEYRQNPYLVMEYVAGPTLLELVSKTQLPMLVACSIGLQICQGMAYAHKQGIIHRDLTLRNVMIAEGEAGEQQAKILDFGLAKVLHEEVQTTGRSMMGTPYYMAPEQIRNESIDGRVDVFAFGVGLHRLVNGRFPFQAEHPAALMYLILNEFSIEFADGVPPSLKELILRCLEKDPRQRAKNFDELIPDLEVIHRECSTVVAGSSTSLAGLDVFANRSSKRNPYLNRVMIKHPGEFYGRKREVRKIYSRLDAPHPQSISVVGDRRIGKSSLLNYIYHPRNRKRHMQSYETSIFAYLDFQRAADYDVPKFINFLFNMFSYETRNGKDYTKLPSSLDALKDVVQELSAEGKRIIVLMDEFEIITRNEKFSESFFSFLRALANSYKVAFVTSSYEDLQKLCHNKDISDSPFFNIFSNLPLRPFTREEAMELVIEPSKTEGVPLERFAPRILDLAGLFPLFLQIACSNVFEHLLEDPDAEPDWPEIERAFKDEVEQHYNFIWDHFDDPSRENLQRIATGRAVNKQYRFVTEELERRGYLVEGDGGVDLCSASFKEFVARQSETGKKKRGFLGGILGRRRP